MENEDKEMHAIIDSSKAALPFVRFCIDLIEGLQKKLPDLDGIHGKNEDGSRKYNSPNVPAMRKLFNDKLSVPEAVATYKANYLVPKDGAPATEVEFDAITDAFGEAAKLDPDFVATLSARHQYGPMFDVMFPIWLTHFLTAIQKLSPDVKLTDDNYCMFHQEVLKLFLNGATCEQNAQAYIVAHPLPTTQFNPNEARHVH